ncbi:hypothetical protein WJX73_007140 [Symbiochloris irregularis]|uniref:Homologous-pairing protein 2 homolog n=1 Tax=Symbiochloris irregularis TaxID=706552 RepID=A0AAW1PAZ9_9CHLO
MADDQVLAFVKQQNRPYNVQIITDNLAQFGVKKGQVQRAVDALAEAQKIICKEFGKVKIYMPPQDSADEVPKEELERRQQQVKALSQECLTTGDSIKQAQKELQALSSSLTAEQIEQQTAALQAQIAEQDAKLSSLKGSTRLVSVADRAAAEKALSANLLQWGKRKSIFKEIWDNIRENIDQNHKQLLEDMGVETDEQMNVDLPTLQRFISKRARKA